jgi:hypothetical protein
MRTPVKNALSPKISVIYELPLSHRNDVENSKQHKQKRRKT